MTLVTDPQSKYPVKLQPGKDRPDGGAEIGRGGRRPGIAFLTCEITPGDANAWGIPRAICSPISAVTASGLK